GVSPGPRRERFVSGAPSGLGGRGTWRGPGPRGDVTDGGGGALSGPGAAPDRRAAPDGGARGRGGRPALRRERCVGGGARPGRARGGAGYRSAGCSAITVQEPGAISVKPASRTRGRRLAVRAAQWAGPGVRTATGKPASRQAARSSSPSSNQASCAPWPAWAIALPADMSRSGFIHRTGTDGSGGAGASGSSRSVPETWRRARSLGQPSRGTGGKTRTSADAPVT